MAEKYQTLAKKSTKKFEVLGRKELAMSVPLALVEVWEDLQEGVEPLTGIAGLKIIAESSRSLFKSSCYFDHKF